MKVYGLPKDQDLKCQNNMKGAACEGFLSLVVRALVLGQSTKAQTFVVTKAKVSVAFTGLENS